MFRTSAPSTSQEGHRDVVKIAQPCSSRRFARSQRILAIPAHPFRSGLSASSAQGTVVVADARVSLLRPGVRRLPACVPAGPTDSLSHRGPRVTAVGHARLVAARVIRATRACRAPRHAPGRRNEAVGLVPLPLLLADPRLHPLTVLPGRRRAAPENGEAQHARTHHPCHVTFLRASLASRRHEQTSTNRTILSRRPHECAEVSARPLDAGPAREGRGGGRSARPPTEEPAPGSLPQSGR
jgi:hypothetical protein